MHQNMLKAFDGLKPEEIIQAEECLDHSVQEFMGKEPQMRRNAKQSSYGTQYGYNTIGENYSQNVTSLFEDDHYYEINQC